jgi:hypothetical protein
MNTLQNGNPPLEITIKVFENSDKVQAKNKYIWNRRPSVDSSFINWDDLLNFNNSSVLMPDKKGHQGSVNINLKGNDNQKKKYMYVSNFHWQKLKRRGKSYGPTNNCNYDESLQRPPTSSKRSKKNFDNRGQLNGCDNIENSVFIWGTNNLPGINKNLFINDEALIAEAKKDKRREEKRLFPSFFNANQSVSRKRDEPEYFTKSLKSSTLKNTHPYLMHINGIVLSPFPVKGKFYSLLC